ncbi:phage terminase small subunit P27 family [Streptacidiphilus albus]|uniref:phage terminase small subunit P27 family n=1 Tax=Streptacidiphilus albus TaxID=105425 RepID=UPI001364A351|nr:phage terminase small subunit P27 family [Streptacidiphilus albus]
MAGNANSGRPKTPAAIKELMGNPGKREIPVEPKAPDGIPSAPHWLNDGALKQWNRITPILSGMGILTLADRDCLTAYCVSYDQFVTATRSINETGIVVDSYRGGVAKNPALMVQSQALAEMNRWGAALGLSPVARARLAVAPELEADAQADVLRLLTGG